MVAGFYDIFNHITEQYFSGTDDCTSDYVMEGLMRSLVHSSRIAVQNPQDYEARSNIMWIATWALNTMVAKGKATDWMVHMIGQSVGAYTDATHGMTLAAVSLPYYQHILPYGLPKFKRFAMQVWQVDPNGKTDETIAEEGLCAMEAWMQEIGLVLHSRELGVTEDMLDGIADGTFIMDGGYKKLDHAEIVQILKIISVQRKGNSTSKRWSCLFLIENDRFWWDSMRCSGEFARIPYKKVAQNGIFSLK